MYGPLTGSPLRRLSLHLRDVWDACGLGGLSPLARRPHRLPP